MKVILADGQALFREGMQHLLMRLDDDVLVLEADSHDSALKLMEDHPDADLALVDLHMPGRANDFSGLMELLGHSQTIPLVVLSGSEDMDEVQQVIKSGAMGFIPKHEHADVMLCALHLVLSGSVYIPPLLMHSHLASQHHKAHLTPKQIEVLKELCKGYSNKEIAQVLHLSEATIKCHTSAILRELEVGSRTQAISVAKQRGLVA